MKDVHPFYKTKLIYDVLDYISEKRYTLVSDLVAYCDDPVRYKRRLRMLLHLSEYETGFLKKIKDFDPDHYKDFDHETFLIIRREVDSITHLGA